MIGMEYHRCTVPVLFLVFNRPAHARATLARLRDVQPSRLYVHCDGPRPGNAQDLEKVQSVRMLIEQEIDWPCEVFTLFRDENAGLRKGVFGAISWFFEAEEKGIILEDDCVPDPSFFAFCAELLDRYSHDEQIMHIGGSNLIAASTQNLRESYVFSRFSFVWGWAGWRRAWAKMSLNLDGLDDFDSRQYLPGTMSRAYMDDKFRVTKAGRNNSWAYAWFYSIIKNNGMCIVPKNNLVQNTGVGEEGATNTRGRNEAARLAAGALTFPLVHPVDKKIDAKLEQRFFFATQKRQARLWLWYLLHRLGLR